MDARRPTPELLLAHTGFVRELARHLLGDAHQAEDVAQETLAIALERPPRSGERLRAWLAAVTRNLARQSVRGAGHRRAREEVAARGEALAGPAEVAEREAARAAVVRALLELSEPLRRTLILRYYEGLAVRDIAEHMDVPQETVRTRLRRGLARLRVALEGEYGDGERSWTRALAPLAGLPGGAQVTAAFAPSVLAGAAAKVVALVAAVALGLVVWRVLEPRGGKPPEVAAAQPAASDTRESHQEAVAPGAAQERTALAGPVHATIRGVVVDERGATVEGASVYASTGGPLFPQRRSREDAGAGVEGDPEVQRTVSGADGAFDLVLDASARAYVGVQWLDDPLLLAPEEGSWVDAPADDVRIVVQVAPHATLVVRARDEASGAALEGFEASVWKASTRSYQTARTEGRELRLEVAFARGCSADETEVEVSRGELAPYKTRVRLEAGGTCTVDAVLATGGAVRGTVVDGTGAPIEDALVFFGIQARMRGDEPFKPFEAKRVPDAARTGADGRFEVSGSGDRLTAWHPERGSTTVPLADAEQIVLPEPGAILGRVVDPDGNPLDKVLVTLDRSETQVTGPDGAFAFEKVLAGVRGVQVQAPVAPDGSSPRPRWIAVEVASGEEVTLELGDDERDFELELVDATGAPALDSKVMLLGLDPIAPICEVPLEAGRGALRTRPGRYLVATREGPFGVVALDAPVARIAAGSGDLTVTGPAGAHVFLAPEGSSELIELMCARVSARAISGDGEVRFDALPTGRWSLGVSGRGVQTVVDVAGPGARVALP